jgi:hypothetical protein
MSAAPVERASPPAFSSGAGLPFQRCGHGFSTLTLCASSARFE